MPTESVRKRLRFEGLDHDVRPDGSCVVRVHLEWLGQGHEAQVTGLETHQGRLRACALATLEAACSASEADVGFELLGVKAVRAFDGWVVVTRVDGAGAGNHYRLLGSAACEKEAELMRTTVSAVLDATNRVLEKYVLTERRKV